MSMLIMSRGPIMLDIVGQTLNADDLRRLKQKGVGGVILFTRNFASYEQLQDLIQQIKQIRIPQLIIGVDHEGGRVQRFKQGITPIPAMEVLGKIALNKGIKYAQEITTEVGFVLASELRAVGIDFSFTPVLDINYGNNDVISDRSFGLDFNIIITLAKSLLDGLRLGGMASCGKHFPGHGFVTTDSHTSLPKDSRSLYELEQSDILAFKALIKYGLDSIMIAHIIYEQIDTLPAGFSAKWLRAYLREKLHFQGVIFSDDLNMQGAKIIDNIQDRVDLALKAGCDITLICNDFQELDNLLAQDNKFADADYAWYKVAGRGDMKNYLQLLQTKEFKKLQQKISLLV